MLRDVGPQLERVKDKAPDQPLAETGAKKALYIDNFAAISASAEAASELVDAAQARFHQAGISVSRDVPGANGATLLGFQFDKRSKTWRPTSKRYWRIAGALDYALQPGRLVSGKEMEGLVGHLVSCSALRRELLSVLCRVCVFARETRRRRVPLRPSVRKDLRWARDLMPLVVARCSLP